MSISDLSLTFSDIRNILVAIADIVIIWLILYYTLRIVRNNKRTTQIFKGILLILTIDILAQAFNLKTLKFLMDIFVNWGFLAFIIIFQPEIRAVLERMGKSGVFSRITTLTGDEKEALVDNIVTAVMLLSKNQTGALICIEQTNSLEDYINTGTRLNSDVTAELLTSIFVTTTPLHDGAVIIQGDKIACASAYLPSTAQNVPTRYGARHRAAMGMSEVSDALIIVVSEETGEVSIAEQGSLTVVNRQQLRDYLLRTILGDAIEVKDLKKVEEKLDPNYEEEKKDKDGLLSKLAIRKQGDETEEVAEEGSEKVEEIEETVEEKIEVEEVVSPEVATSDTSNFEQVNEEAKEADMKFPHRKNAETISYEDEIENTASIRMTKEEVAAAREESKRKLQQMNSTENEKAKVLSDEEDKKFDTSMINISKIVGFEGELDDQFETIEQLSKEDIQKITKKEGSEDGAEE